MSYRNPILPGFHPDPSICRVGDDFYLVTSSFEYFPGLPLYHSRDLVNWRHLGYCMTRPEQLPLAGARASGGMFAPTLRYHEGRFHVVAKNVTACQMVCVHTADPAGEWSAPVWLGQWGGDPSFCFGSDGRCYLTVCGEEAIHQTTVDPLTGAYDGPLREIWRGTGGAWVEGPHLYEIDGAWYLLAAEGGTRYGHMVTIARAASPWGPWESCPWNPVLTHRSTSSPIQATGHADLVRDPRGNWWLVCLAFRPVRDCHHLGRETYLAPVTWEDGWPRVGDHGRIALEMDGPMLPEHPWPALPARDDFAAAALRPEWNVVRSPDPAACSLAARPGWLRLHGRELVRRQQHFDCRAETLVDFTPAGDAEAGLTVRMNETHHAEIAVALVDGVRRAIAHVHLGSVTADRAGPELPAGPVRLAILADAQTYRLGVMMNGTRQFPATDNAPECGGRSPAAENGRPTPAEKVGGDLRAATLAIGRRSRRSESASHAVGDCPAFTEVARVECRFLSSEVAGGHTGVFVGIFARHVPADFDWFEYAPT